MSPRALTFGHTKLHKYKQIHTQCTHTHPMDTFHPTCSVNREQDVADIWMHGQARYAPSEKE